LKFSDGVEISFRLDSHDNVDDTIDAIRRLDIGGGNTNIALALRTARTRMFPVRPNSTTDFVIPRLLILVTDGTATAESARTLPEANLTKAAGIHIFTVRQMLLFRRCLLRLVICPIAIIA